MTIKEIAFSAQVQLRADTGVSFKRTHVHELLAASFGFNSLAAFGVDSVLTHLPEHSGWSRSQHDVVIKRCLALGYRRDTAVLAKATLETFLKERRVGIVSISSLVRRLGGESPIWGHALDDDEDSPFDDAGVDEFDPLLLEGLEAAADRDNALAHYALALIHAPDDDEDRLESSDRYFHHLKEAGRLGYPDALLDLAELAGQEVDEDLLVRAAENGNTEAMLELIEGHDRDNLQRCWTWVYLSQLVGTDLLRDAHYPINEDGSDYDDDFGGPAYVAGRGGVSLEPLTTEQDESARLAAQALFAKIRRTAR